MLLMMVVLLPLTGDDGRAAPRELRSNKTFPAFPFLLKALKGLSQKYR
jgi:hypothetical protein